MFAQKSREGRADASESRMSLRCCHHRIACVTPRALRGALAIATFRRELRESRFQRCVQVTRAIGLFQPSEGMCFLGALTQVRIALSGDEDAANSMLLVDLLRDVDAICSTRQTDIHQDEVGSLAGGEQHRFCGCIGDTDTPAARTRKLCLAIHRCDVLILDDENSWCRGHVNWLSAANDLQASGVRIIL